MSSYILKDLVIQAKVQETEKKHQNGINATRDIQRISASILLLDMSVKSGQES